MFSQNNEEKKLDWMYKGPTSMVNREDYLLGRSVDKSLEQLNEEEKQKQLGITLPKNRVEHECIPPSIRDFNKVVQSEQVDLSTKLQEDPLVAIRKREEEFRRQFLQNPVQVKKLQKALKAQEAKKSKNQKKHKSKNDKLKAKNKINNDLDTILMHKFNELKNKLSESDLKEILAENEGSSSSDDSDLDAKLLEKLKNSQKKQKTYKKDSSSSEESSDEEKYNSRHNRKKNYKRKSERKSSKTNKDSSEERQKERRKRKQKQTSSSESSEESDSKNRHQYYDSDSERRKPQNWGLVKSDGSKIPLKKSSTNKYEKPKKQEEPPKTYKREKRVNLTEEEKERRRREMIDSAAIRDKERSFNLKRHRENEEREKERQLKDYDPEFAHKQFIKSTKSSTVESRIKANVNKIQRSGRDMNTHFSKR